MNGRSSVKVRHVELVRPDDPGYLATMSAQAQAHRRYGPRQDPGEIYRASGLAETGVRSWLGQRLPLLEERVLAVELLPTGRGSYERRYLELDAVEGRAGTPTRILEVKFSANQSAVQRGLRQLERARVLLSHRWERVSTLLVLVEANRRGVVLDVGRFRSLRLVAPEDLMRPAGGPGLLVLPLAALAGFLSRAEIAAIERGRDEGEILTGLRLARAAEGEGGTTERRGDGGHTGTQTSAAATLTFGDPNDDAEVSPFAALRRLSPEGDPNAGG